MATNLFARLLNAAVLGLAVLQVGAVGVSVSGLPLTRATALALVAAAGLIAWRGAIACTAAWPHPGAHEDEPYRSPSRGMCLVMTAASGLLAAIYVSLWAIAAFYPDLTCDGNAYHIPAIHQWASAGRIHWIAWPGCLDLAFLNGYPKGAETVAYVLATALNSSRWINATNLVFLPLGVLGLTAACRTAGVSKRLSLLAGCTWIGVPVNLFQAPTTYCDSAFASCAIAWLALTFILAHHGCSPETPAWRTVVPWGAALGLTLSAKGLGAALAVVGTTGLGTFLVIHGMPGKSLVIRCRTAARLLLIGLLTAALTGGFWYLRNWIVAGSPLYPVGLCVMGRRVFPGQTVAASIDALRNTPPELRGQPWPWQVAHAWLQSLPDGWPDSLAGVDAHLGGIGFLWVAGCVPALLGLLLAARRGAAIAPESRRALLFLAGVSALAFLATPLRWWARYTCWIYAAGIPPLAWLAEQALTAPRPRTFRRIWPPALLSVVLCEAVMGWSMLLDQAVGFRRASGGSGTPRAALLAMFPEARGTSLEALCLGSAVVAVGPMSGQSPSAGRFRAAIVGPFCLPVGRRRIVGLGADATSADVTRLTPEHVRDVIWSSDLPLPPALRAAASGMEAVGGFVVVHLRE